MLFITKYSKGIRIEMIDDTGTIILLYAKPESLYTSDNTESKLAAMRDELSSLQLNEPYGPLHARYVAYTVQKYFVVTYTVLAKYEGKIEIDPIHNHYRFIQKDKEIPSWVLAIGDTFAKSRKKGE